ncbi:hypothetical protein M441DRAFT_52390 [Trichoderma asperellum CBS 433.97]|uniref:Uncharacterized protein n=1 Tax=Trichoderma asperellum (strain ATCC 204424 / CBS 433.97 / NBRC 101777) TaxID=1042311 RepID=A0A2T3YRD8_TRIA4|nr:hypothetical protein M441DRAFT_52390 [Trichoderma asperellum CBS 433.97]PTB35140.1 hypothetical protein M441DRAFT_52390 [Trichoderma asperellum CBS 433.97]
MAKASPAVPRSSYLLRSAFLHSRAGVSELSRTEQVVLKKDEYVRRLRLDNGFRPLEYKNIVITFLIGRLTFEADVGCAYLGTQNYLDKIWRGHRFYWGLHHGGFGLFLMREWVFITDRRKREGTHPMRLTDRSIARVPFQNGPWAG